MSKENEDKNMDNIKITFGAFSTNKSIEKKNINIIDKGI